MKSSGRTAPRKSPPRSRRVPPAEPLAAALLDHYRDGRPRRVTALRADGVEFEIETEEYFTLDGELAPLDRMALERARGRVLDVGAGSGRHALALQAKGCEVVAIDVSPACVELCRERGVRDVRLVDVMTIGSGNAGGADAGAGDLGSADADAGDDAGPDRDLGRFDTIFFGMQTIGVAGGVKPLRILLARLRGRLNPGGIVLADSSELREVWDGDASDRSAERGEIVLATRYGRLRGEPFPWVYLAEADLAAVAQAAGYTVETLMRVESGEYLVELRAATGAASDAVPGDGTSGDAVSRRGGAAAR